MNSQLPPVDPMLRAHLARRSAGPVPEDLLAATYARLDVAPPQPRRWTVYRVPRLAIAGGALALIAVLAAALVVFPRSQVGPAASGQWSYPAERALTSAELAALMSGPALPTNAALVASVTIDRNTDVCPMNRYATIGVVEGMGGQVCVVNPGVPPYVSTPKATGAFAFRYLAPGYLGLLGEITPASSAKVAFRVADDWPLAGKTFLVEGWLTQLRFPVTDAAFCTGGTPVPAGDPLDPSGSDPCVGTWLTDETSSLPTEDSGNLIEPKAARFVEAAGMGEIDAIPGGVAVAGVYVVRSVTEPCPSALPQDSRGCSAWRVLARVAEISVPGPRGTPPGTPTVTPTTAPPATPITPSLTGVIGTGDRPLTADELETLLVDQPDHLAGRIVIVEAPIPTQISCQSDAGGGGCAVNTKSLAGDGVWAVSIGADGTLSLIGQMSTPATGGYVFALDQVNAAPNLNAGDSLIVEGWLLEYIVTCDFGATPLPAGCGPYSTIASTASDNSPATFYVQQGAFEKFTGTSGDWRIEGPPVHGLFLVRVTNANGGTLLARLESVTP